MSGNHKVVIMPYNKIEDNKKPVVGACVCVKMRKINKFHNMNTVIVQKIIHTAHA